MNKQKITYPSARDLKIILSDCVRKTDLLSFLRTKGILFFNITPNELSEKISEMLLTYDELEQIRSFAYRSTNKQILNGFSLISSGPFDLSDIYNSIRNQGTMNSDGYKLNSISRRNSENGIVYEGSITYTKKAAGRIEFIRCEERDVFFVMKSIDEKHWQVEVDGGKSNDGKTVFNMLEKLVKGKNISLNMLRIDNLTKAETITFFDRLEKVATLNINELALAVRNEFLPGEKIKLRIVEKGSGRGQGVGHLKDGTMVVVDNAAGRVGQEVVVEFVKFYETSAGKMIFAKLAKKR